MNKAHIRGIFQVFIAMCLLSAPTYGDDIYVSVYASNTIEKFDSSGQATVFASGGGLDGPSGMAFDSSGNLYVANINNSTIWKYDSNGHGTLFADTYLNDPAYLAFDRNGYLYVSNEQDNGSAYADTVVRFDPNGNGSVFASGLHEPYGLAFDNQGNLYVGNLNDPSIWKFDSNGNGSLFANMYDPGQLTCDSNGNLYMANHYSTTVVKFDSSGNSSIYESGLNQPGGLAFDSSGNLYVGTYYSGYQIVKFDPSGVRSVFAYIGGIYAPSIAVRPVPEPSGYAMLVLGAGVIFAGRKTKIRKGNANTEMSA